MTFKPWAICAAGGLLSSGAKVCTNKERITTMFFRSNRRPLPISSATATVVLDKFQRAYSHTFGAVERRAIP